MQVSSIRWCNATPVLFIKLFDRSGIVAISKDRLPLKIVATSEKSGKHLPQTFAAVSSPTSNFL